MVFQTNKILGSNNPIPPAIHRSGGKELDGILESAAQNAQKIEKLRSELSLLQKRLDEVDGLWGFGLVWERLLGKAASQSTRHFCKGHQSVS